LTLHILAPYQDFLDFITEIATIEGMYERLNISFNNRESSDARLLSNLAHTPFDLDGVRWASVEAFWKALYHPEPTRPVFHDYHGIPAWAIFLDRPYPKTIQFHGRTIEVGSVDHHVLMERALRAKIRHNTSVQEALKRTRYRVYEHIPLRRDGTIYPGSTTIPGPVFAHMLSELRDHWLIQNNIDD
jgi:predicted NAD-dependent protein-ADP-ribosyltransferase YbiA (DUF1768 family)